jgi:hypothetical protein
MSQVQGVLALNEWLVKVDAEDQDKKDMDVDESAMFNIQLSCQDMLYFYYFIEYRL